MSNAVFNTKRNTVAEKLFLILRKYLDGKNVQIDEYIQADIQKLIYLCKIHGLQPILYRLIIQGREKWFGLSEEQTKNMKEQYITDTYRSLQQEISADEMEVSFSGNQVPLVFFKGILIRNFYRDPQFRTMGDIDCVIPKEKRNLAHILMLDMGYTCELDKGNTWVYSRGSVSVEMHTSIVNNTFRNVDCRAFFADALEHTEKLGKYTVLTREYHFCFLIYHIAKHLYSTGAGIRMFLDIAVLLKYYSYEFDWNMVQSFLNELKLSKVAGAVFQLCRKWFEIEVLWPDQINQEALEQLEEYVLAGGIFGFATHDVGDVYLRRGYEKNTGKHRYYFWLIWNYLFPTAENMMQIMPCVETRKWLLPVAWVKRLWVGVFRRREHSLNTLKSMLKNDKGRGKTEYQMLKELGL